MEGVEGEVVVGKDEVSEGYEYRETMSMGDVSFQGGDINADKQDIGVKGEFHFSVIYIINFLKNRYKYKYLLVMKSKQITRL